MKSWTRISALLAASLLALSVSACGPTGRYLDEKTTTDRTPYPYDAQGRLTGPDAPKPENAAATEPASPADAPWAGGEIKIALLLPLSGGSATLGNAMSDAAMLALYDHYLSLPPDVNRPKITLITKDTGATPLQAEAAAKEALAEGARVILGPLFRHSVAPVAALAKAKNVPVITFSNDAGAAGAGVYVMGFLPAQQVDRVALYALNRGLSRFAALGPNDTFGHAVTQTFQQTIVSKGAQMQGVELYATQPASMTAAVARIHATMESRSENERVQGLFLAEGGATLDALFPLLQAQQIQQPGIRFLGTGMWDELENTRKPQLMGAWFASSPPTNVAWFEKRFQSSYRTNPPRLAGLAYDAVSMVCALGLLPGGPDFSPQAIANPNGFIGPANGLFRFTSNGLSERKLAVLEITAAGVKVLDPAPKSFAGE